MVEIVKFVCIINIFIFLFLVATNVEVSYFIHNILSYYCYTILFSFFLTASFTRCFRDSNCPKSLCHPPTKPKCMYKSICKCIREFSKRDYVHT
ncbi:Nodule Cysteine-Rich (NCR) secreted peptide [Medicago truncatula]|uniref:Nodule Cysteine-Rich (NCR) secreted peptide n=1 Tax=Medicago truncatula TaxID=3880 RepID=A0A072U8J5_MEDTR|nr:Nodule Cysteine-Rich (NCR) secreted peptide [Medicago truncatula]